MKKGLRSNSLTRKTPETPTAQARKFSDLSPETESQHTKKTKKSSMNEQDINKLLDAFCARMEKMIDSTNNKIETMCTKLEQQMNKLDKDVQELRNDFVETKEEIKRIEENQSMASEKIQQLEVRQNIIEQLALENQILMLNLPPSITKDKLVESINSWTDNLIKSHSIKRINLVAKTNKKSAFIHFTTVTDKQLFMDFVKAKRKDGNEKYVPIINEQVFQLEEGDTSKANVIEFQTLMTQTNKQIFDAIRNAKKTNSNIERTWISNGSVFLKLKSQTKSIRIDTLQHFNNISSSVAMEI